MKRCHWCNMHLAMTCKRAMIMFAVLNSKRQLHSMTWAVVQEYHSGQLTAQQFVPSCYACTHTHSEAHTNMNGHSGRGASSGVGFAIPVDSVKGLVEQILKFGRVIRPVLGITIAPPQTVRQLGLDGILVLEAPSGSPANLAGIKGTIRQVSLMILANFRSHCFTALETTS